jgi:hypothetical protein
MATAVLVTGIPFPATTPPSGQVKFLNRDQGQQLGYVLKLPIGPNTTGRPLFNIEGNFEFTPKDADGFVLTKISGPTETLWVNSDNTVRGTTEEVVPESVIDRTKEVDVKFTATSCYPCAVR